MADIIVDTSKLDGYAQRLGSVNARIASLDFRLSALYSRAGLLDLWNLIQADALTCYSWRLLRCQGYLQQTAADFASVEQQLLSEDPANFKGVVVGETIITDGSADPNSGTDDDERSWFAKFINNDIKASGAAASGEASTEGNLWGIGTAGSASGSVFAGEAGFKSSGSLDFKDKDGNWNLDKFGFTTKGYASGAVAQGEVKGNVGYLHGSASGKYVTGAVSGQAVARFMEDGKFNPSLLVEGSIEGSMLQGETECGFGTDQYGVYAKADGDLFHAEVKGKAGVGYIGTDDNGNPQYGATAKFSAMASAAQGKVKGGFTIFGIDIDVGVSGYAGAAGVEGGASITTDGVKAKLSGAMALGVGVDISIDWSDAKWIGDSIDAVGDFFEGAVDTVGGFLDGAADFIDDFFGGPADPPIGVGEPVFL